jgi:hypothetical protein
MRAVRTSARDERGYVMIVVLALVMIGLLVATAAVTSQLATKQSAARDARVRRAQAAADAGVQTTLYQQSEADLGSSTYNFNGGLIGLSNFLDCWVPQLNVSLQVTGIASAYANAAGVCPQALSSGGTSTTFTPKLGQNTSYSAEMLTGQTNFLSGTSISGQNGSAMRELFPKIVSIGIENSTLDAGTTTTNGVTTSLPVYSREEAILAPIAPLQTIEGENSVKICGLSALGLCVAAVLNGDVLSRGDLTTPAALTGLNLSGSSPSGLLATLAYSGTLHGGLAIANVQHTSSSNIISRSPVTIANGKQPCASSTGTTETCSNALFSCASCYSAATDSFSLTSGSATIPSGDYVFCNFSATGGTLTISPTSSAPVRIFIDSPSSSRCSGDGLGSNQGNFNDTDGFSNTIANLGNNLAPSGFQVYLAGNGTGGGTSVQIGPTSTTSLLSLSAATFPGVIYAPMSNVTVNVPALCVVVCTGGLFEGNAIGYNTTINALTITQDLDLGNYPLYAGVNAFRVTQYVQCDTSVTSLTGTTADLNGC